MLSYTVDDHDLDDAELWAVIDSAAAVHSSATRSRKPTALRSPTFSPPAPASNSASGFHSNPRKRIAAAGHSDGRACSDGEVLQEEPWRHSPPIKQSRVYTGRDGSDNQIVLLRRGVGSGPPTTPFAAAPSYSSPDCNNFSSPVVESPTAHSLSGRFPTVNLFKQYQNAAMAILERTDYTLIHGQPFIKKSGWRKISFYFNLSFEIKDKTIEFDENRNVQRAEFVVRAYMQGGRFSDGWGSCERREKRFMKPNHDIPSTAETRAKNKACQDLLGIGEYRQGSSDVNR